MDAATVHLSRTEGACPAPMASYRRRCRPRPNRAGRVGRSAVPSRPGGGRSDRLASVARVTEVGAALGVALGHLALDGGRHQLGRESPAAESGPARIRLMLEQLGPTFTKLGQLLAGRPELLPSAYRAELARLQDDAVSLPGVVVLRLLDRVYDQPLTAIFEGVSLQPVASGSIGQVHRATLVDGRSVAIKIQRPDAAPTIEADLRTLGSVVRAADRFIPPLRRLALAGLVEEFADALRAELDYDREATHAGDIARGLDRVPWVTVPDVVPSLCRPGVLVMEFAEGIPLTDKDALDRAGIDRRQVAGRVVLANLQLILFSDTFHADPHAGNFLIAPDGQLVMLDFGQVGHSAGQTRADLLSLVTSLVSGDAAQVARAVGSICQTDPEDIDGLGDDVAGLVAQLSDQPLGEFRIGTVLHRLLAILGRHHLSVPGGMTMLVKAVIECEATAEELSGEIRLAELLPHLGDLGAPPTDTTGLVPR